MRRIILIIILIFPFITNAQSPFQFEIESRSGYEHNVFNANSNKFTVAENGDSTSAVRSGFFQHFNTQVSWKRKFKTHQFNAKIRARYDYFPQMNEANLFRPELNLGYRYKFNKKTSLFFKTKYLKYQTNRIPDETEVLSLPTAYQRTNGDLGVKFKPTKNNKSQIQLSLLEKEYVAGEESQLKYYSIGLNFQTTQRFRKKDKSSNYLSFEVDIRRRNYSTTFFEEDFEGEDFEEQGRRVWQYHTAQLEYTFAQSKKIKIKTGLAFQQRLDLLNEEFGYQQWQPFVKLEMKKERLKLVCKVEGVMRSFSNLTATSDRDEFLEHRYFRTSLNLNYVMTKQLSLTLQGNFRKRWRNFSEGATNYLPYMNGMISAGVKYRF